MREILIAPSLLAADFADFNKAIKDIENSGADWVHLDIMDGQFVPNITFGHKLVEDLRKRSNKFFDVHLMIKNPEKQIQAFASSGANSITFQAETVKKPIELIKTIKNLGLLAGICIDSGSSPRLIDKALPFCDIVLVMTVKAGKGGQSLIPQCLEKAAVIAKKRENSKLDFKISVDGGIHQGTARDAVQSGADIMVLGSAFFGSTDKSALVRNLKNL